MITKRGVLIAALGGAVAACVAMPPSAANPGATTDTRRYVGQSNHFIGTAIAAQQTGVMLQGEVDLVARADRLVMRFEDDAAASGESLHVVVVTGRGESQAVRHLCVPEGSPTAIEQLHPGQDVRIAVLDPTYRSDCDTGGTTGLLHITN